MMGNSEELRSALLVWVNTFELQKDVRDWSELLDGFVIWQILQDIDPEYFHGALPEPDAGQSTNWIPKWANCRTATTIASNEKGS